jgi:hypothetical protein
VKNPFVKCLLCGLLLGLPLSGHALDQWASFVIGYSSQYGTSSWSAAQALGAPNVSSYGDNSRAWAPKNSNGTLDYLIVGFSTPDYATGATIVESDGYGFVYRIDAIDTYGNYHTVWSGYDNSLANQINYFRPTWAKTSYLVKGLAIYIDTNATSSWEEIDAVQLNGGGGGAASGGLKLQGYWSYNIQAQRTYYSTGPAQSGSKNNLGPGYYRYGYVSGGDIANNRSSGYSGSLSLDFWRLNYYGGTTGTLLFTRGFDRLYAGYKHSSVYKAGYFKSPGTYGYALLQLSEYMGVGYGYQGKDKIAYSDYLYY